MNMNAKNVKNGLKFCKKLMRTKMIYAALSVTQKIPQGYYLCLVPLPLSLVTVAAVPHLPPELFKKGQVVPKLLSIPKG